MKSEGFFRPVDFVAGKSQPKPASSQFLRLGQGKLHAPQRLLGVESSALPQLPVMPVAPRHDPRQPRLENIVRRTELSASIATLRQVPDTKMNGRSGQFCWAIFNADRRRGGKGNNLRESSHPLS